MGEVIINRENGKTYKAYSKKSKMYVGHLPKPPSGLNWSFCQANSGPIGLVFDTHALAQG